MNHTLYRTPQKDRGSALDRKMISSNFHTTSYPSFGYSTGPFRVYEHSVAKGTVKQVQRCRTRAQ